MASGYSIYVERPSYIHQVLDPRTKTAAVAAFFGLSLCLNHPAPLGVMTAFLIGIAAWIRLPLSLMRMLLLSCIWFVFLSLIIWPAYISTGTPLFSIGSITITSVGLAFGLAMGLRIAIMVLVAGIWMASTSPQKLTAALMKMRISPKVAMSVSLTIRLVPMIASEWSTIVEAQKSRGVDYKSGNLFSRINKSVMILGPMILRSLDIAQSLSIALESRAFGARKGRTCITEVQLRPIDITLIACFMLFIILGIAFRLAGIGVLVPHYL